MRSWTSTNPETIRALFVGLSVNVVGRTTVDGANGLMDRLRKGRADVTMDEAIERASQCVATNFETDGELSCVSAKSNAGHWVVTLRDDGRRHFIVALDSKGVAVTAKRDHR